MLSKLSRSYSSYLLFFLSSRHYHYHHHHHIIIIIIIIIISSSSNIDMLSIDAHAHPKVSSHRRRSHRTNTKRPRIITTSFSPLPCKRPKSTTDDPYSTENLLDTLENLKAKSTEQIRRVQQLKCVELTAALVDFFC